jgi:hypothetical protein
MSDLPPTAEQNRRVTVLLKLKETLANQSASVSQPSRDSGMPTSK